MPTSRDEALVKAALEAAAARMELDAEIIRTTSPEDIRVLDPAAIIASVPRSFEDDLRALAAGDAKAEAFAEKLIAAGAPEPRGYGADISSSTSAGNFRLPPDPRDAEIERLRNRADEAERVRVEALGIVERQQDEIERLRSENGKLTDIILSAQGGEPLTILDQLDDAKAEIGRLREMVELERTLREQTVDARNAEIERLREVYEVVRQDRYNLTEKVIPGLRQRVQELEALLREAREDWVKVGYGASHEDVAALKDFCNRIDAALGRKEG